MKNADVPAMPVTGFVSDASGALAGEFVSNKGLTKREMMAMHMMASIQVSDGHYDLFENMARDAVIMADALLSELELTSGK